MKALIVVVPEKLVTVMVTDREGWEAFAFANELSVMERDKKLGKAKQEGGEGN